MSCSSRTAVNWKWRRPARRRRSRWRNWLTILVVFPLLLNLVVRTFGWIALLAQNGLVNQALQALGVVQEPVKLLFNFAGLLIGLTHIFLPFMVLVLIGPIQNIPRDVEDAARGLRGGAAAHGDGAGARLPLRCPRAPDGSARVTAARFRGWLLRVWVALVFAFLMLPVVVIALASFSRTSYLTIPPKGVTLRWFGAVLGDPEYVYAIGFSLSLALVATVGSLAAGVAASYALIRRRVPGGALVSALLNAPLIFPGVVVGVALLQFYALVHMNGTLAGLARAHMVITVPY